MSRVTMADLTQEEFEAVKTRVRADGEREKITATIRPERKISWTTAELLSHDFPPIQWIAPGLIAPGLTVLAGAPKLGKSWMALQLATACSCGGAVFGTIRVPKVKALYLALEDTPRRLQSRLTIINAMPSDDLRICTEWKRGPEGIELLRKWLEANPETRLVVIDTWGRFQNTKDGNDYSETTDAAALLKAVADDFDLALIVVHHARKAGNSGGGDFLESILGSTGLAAAADTSLVLRRARGNKDAVLGVTGRDVPEEEYSLMFDPDVGSWTIVGTSAEVQESDARQAIYDVISEADGAMTPKAIADELKKNRSTVRTLLGRMVDDGVLMAMSGKYSVFQTGRKPVDTVDRRQGNPTETGQSVYESMLSTPLQGGQSPDREEIELF